MLTLIILTAHSNPGNDMSIGERFHQETGYSDQGYKSDKLKWGKSVPLYKKYPKARRVKLPKPAFSGKTVEQAIRQRRSHRQFTDKALTLQELVQLLVSADGLTDKNEQLRAAPSGGALYPVELYIAVHNVEGVEPGLYHFHVSDTSLELIKAGDFADSLHIASNEQETVGASPITIIMTARFDRSTKKYADRGYRYIYMESGSICQNIYLQATSMKMGTVAVGAFNDDALNKLLELDGRSEAALMMMPVGRV
jgi:SagB-type dehydrogenase family enzyme